MPVSAANGLHSAGDCDKQVFAAAGLRGDPTARVRTGSAAGHRRGTRRLAGKEVSMDTSSRRWFVEEFRLRGPLEEFQDFGEHEIERLRNADPEFDDTPHREAIDLVMRKLSQGTMGAKP
jgi:hypothetical protein